MQYIKTRIKIFIFKLFPDYDIIALSPLCIAFSSIRLGKWDGMAYVWTSDKAITMIITDTYLKSVGRKNQFIYCMKSFNIPETKICIV